MKPNIKFLIPVLLACITLTAFAITRRPETRKLEEKRENTARAAAATAFTLNATTSSPNTTLSSAVNGLETDVTVSYNQAAVAKLKFQIDPQNFVWNYGGCTQIGTINYCSLIPTPTINNIDSSTIITFNYSPLQVKLNDLNGNMSYSSESNNLLETDVTLSYNKSAIASLSFQYDAAKNTWVYAGCTDAVSGSSVCASGIISTPTISGSTATITANHIPQLQNKLNDSSGQISLSSQSNNPIETDITVSYYQNAIATLTFHYIEGNWQYKGCTSTNGYCQFIPTPTISDSTASITVDTSSFSTNYIKLSINDTSDCKYDKVYVNSGVNMDYSIYSPNFPVYCGTPTGGYLATVPVPNNITQAASFNLNLKVFNGTTYWVPFSYDNGKWTFDDSGRLPQGATLSSTTCEGSIPCFTLNYVFSSDAEVKESKASEDAQRALREKHKVVSQKALKA